MIYKKPQMTNGEVYRFLKSLPDEFEIVQPGNVQVKWPDGVTRSELDGWCDDLTRYVPENADILRYLRALAAIAPEERKRRLSVWQFKDHDPTCMPMNWTPNHLYDGPNWRKVGECEVTE